MPDSILARQLDRRKGHHAVTHPADFPKVQPLELPAHLTLGLFLALGVVVP
jgi:hypothetical protein